MDHRNSPARPQVSQRPAPNEISTEQQYATPRAQNTWAPSVKPSRRKKWFWPAIIVAVIIILGVIGWLLLGHIGAKKPATDRYQAVFLDNGQSFFGKLKDIDGEYLVLENVYTTKKADIPADATAEQKAALEANVSLTKIGSLIYGPEDTMSIRAEQVLFWQDLKSDSKVTKAIEGDK